MKYFGVIPFIIFQTLVFSQKKQPDNWQTLNPKKDNIYGVASDDALILLKDKKPKETIVAIIDGGVDPYHEDLKEVIWTNANEIPDNGIDDDRNGYVDDIHGWNFIGGKNGDIENESTELARIYQRMEKKFNSVDSSKLSDTDKVEYLIYKNYKELFLKEVKEQEQQLASIEMVSSYLNNIKTQNNGVINKSGLSKYEPQNNLEKRLKKGLKFAFSLGLKPEELETEIEEGKKQISNRVKYNKMNVDSIRQFIIGDDINNPSERYYGNNHYQGVDAEHGTHVSGIIAAVRNNNIGINGISNATKIMIIRAVPNGDERDKDIANSIYYAVDNGASIINMSFGKYYSPDKKAVDDAVKYALLKDVLIIHASGNESKNNDIELSFPSRKMASGEVVNNWIQVGANAAKKGKHLIGSFSNYGKTNVDFFAPGVDVYSTIPNNKYTNLSGTSMASPSAAGSAAIIRSYFPELKASEVREVLLKTVTTYKHKIIIPGTRKEKKRLNELCLSGGIVNVNNAIQKLLNKSIK